ncbi:venom allergen 5-like [Zophobas morio]|uniref:venom allergen 5-like n=1 Tax=Zophobas morio TaxID=2755281 RepID=UPI003083AF62
MVNSLLALCVIFCLTFATSDAKCGQLLGNGVTKTDENVIVNTHNHLRSLISQGKISGQPKAKNLKTLKWDSKLAKEAQKIANTCEFEHVKVLDDRFLVGQNLMWTSSTQATNKTEWAYAIQSWFSEHKNFIYPNKKRGVTGHYTQVVWADTYLVGCGFAWYIQNVGEKNYEKLYVCNYGPAGNFVGEPPYKI